MRPLEFGWYLPTHGDTTAYGVPSAQVAGSTELCERVVAAAEAAKFEYLLIPVGSTCWEAWISGAFMAARSNSIKPLIAARPGYINPVLMAKMISTFDQMSGGRICINLIAGQNESEVEGEGVRYPKEQRYALMDEEVTLLKTLWTTRGPVDFEGQFHTLKGAVVAAADLPAALSEILSRRRLAPGLGDFSKALQRAPVLGRHAGAHQTEHCRDQDHGEGARPRRRDRLRHAAAGDLPRERARRLGRRRDADQGRTGAAEAGARRGSMSARKPTSACRSSRASTAT